MHQPPVVVDGSVVGKSGGWYKWGDRDGRRHLNNETFG
jgi:hypothetical protein